MNATAKAECNVADLWNLDPSFVFLNHGSYGAVPKKILEEQYRLHLHIETQPVRFFAREVEDLLERSRNRLSEFINADPQGVVFVPNATTGVNTVLKSITFSPGDEVVITDHIYNACKNALELVARRDGLKINVVRVPFPIGSKEDVKQLVLEQVTPSTKLVLLDHITSPTALIFPVEDIVRTLNEMGVDVLVDGAHAPGMVPLNLKELNPTYYTGNCHKWLCAPKGSAFLYIREDRRRLVRPLVTSHGANSTRKDKTFLHLEFDWTGTGDYTPYILIPSCLEFLEGIFPGGIRELMDRNRHLALWARRLLCERFDIPLPCPDDMVGSMAAVPILPPETEPLQTSVKSFDRIQELLFRQYRIEVPVISWPSCEKRLVRISAQVYNKERDYLTLAEALREILGHGSGGCGS
ncbi:MAG TPA: aminotransferase class V-fold PLP-dependent enzyme [Firmicutes bacterium]|nr:aminotransferase class V-fold PLP-dependent enzyme [Candidatus Fermentithermobacillaceae bacterium]